MNRGSRILGRITRLASGLLWISCAAGAERTYVRADLFESAGEDLDVGVGDVPGEVSFDSIPVVAAGLVQLLGTRVGEDHQDRTPIVRGADPADEPRLFHSVHDPGKAALAVKDPF